MNIITDDLHGVRCKNKNVFEIWKNSTYATDEIFKFTHTLIKSLISNEDIGYE